MYFFDFPCKHNIILNEDNDIILYYTVTTLLEFNLVF